MLNQDTPIEVSMNYLQGNNTPLRRAELAFYLRTHIGLTSDEVLAEVRRQTYLNISDEQIIAEMDSFFTSPQTLQKV